MLQVLKFDLLQLHFASGIFWAYLLIIIKY